MMWDSYLLQKIGIAVRYDPNMGHFPRQASKSVPVEMLVQGLSVQMFFVQVFLVLALLLPTRLPVTLRVETPAGPPPRTGWQEDRIYSMAYLRDLHVRVLHLSWK
jgi:hypothetical protein